MAGTRRGSPHRGHAPANRRTVAHRGRRHATRILVSHARDARMDGGASQSEQPCRSVHARRAHRAWRVDGTHGGSASRPRRAARRGIPVSESAVGQEKESGHHAHSRGARGRPTDGAPCHARRHGRDSAHRLRERGGAHARTARRAGRGDGGAGGARCRPAQARPAVRHRSADARRPRGPVRRRPRDVRLSVAAAVAVARRGGRGRGAGLDRALGVSRRRPRGLGSCRHRADRGALGRTARSNLGSPRRERAASARAVDGSRAAW